ncbi:uncharacterized protein LOC135834721 [Planococcus citri]|uniref:uncharacterized protein LOC135834721 n=1 Tax=Planococcus citri TaxID=170843 RepID=UPI0031F7418B
MYIKSEAGSKCEKKPLNIDITRTKTVEKDKLPIFDVEISGGWSLRLSRKQKLIDHLFHFSVFSCLIILAFYVIAIHTLLYYETQDTLNLRRKVEHAFTLNEQLENNLQLMKLDMDNVMSELQDLRNELHSKQGNFSDDHEVIRRSVNDSERLPKKGQRSRPKRKEIIAVQFRTYEPFQYQELPMEGTLGPWRVEPTLGKSTIDMFEKSLVYERRHVEISVAGLYFIYSQVSYSGKGSPAYYSINVISASCNDTEEANQSIAQCSSFTSHHVSHDVSCFTSALRVLYPKDIVYLQQVTTNVTVNFEIDYTYFGFVLLNEM